MIFPAAGWLAKIYIVHGFFRKEIGNGRPHYRREHEATISPSVATRISNQDDRRERQPVSKRIQVLERAMKLLDAFDEDHQEMGVTELADRLDLHKATVHRILRTLEEGGFIQQNSENGKYHLGWQLIPLGTLALQHFDLRRLASDLMRALLEEHQETVDMAIYQAGEMYYIEVLESPQPVKIAARPGRGLPIHCTATGKAFLAFAQPEEVDKILSRKLKRYTPLTIIDPDQIRIEFEEIRSKGYATSREEFEDGISAVAAPVFNRKGEVEAVIAIPGPSYRISDERMTTLGKAVCTAAHTLTTRLRGISDVVHEEPS
jgi:DNA-binding IclR family transcriptional regulator